MRVETAAPSPLAVSLTSQIVDTEKPPSVPVQPVYALISPVYNEKKFIGRMIESIAAQTVLPSRWVIVDDGSTDGTQEIIRAYLQRYRFIELICLPKSKTNKPGGEGVIQKALEIVQFYPYEFLGRFDSDLEFCPDYIEKMLCEFAGDEKLGIAGGGLYIEKENRFVLEKVPKYHVRGGVKMYRRKCLEDIGSLCTHMGWDTVDEVHAWRYGWKTRSFFENRVIHKRPTGERLTARELSRQRGQAEYYTWSHPLFVFLKAVKVGAASPMRGFHFLDAFLECYRKQEARLQDADFKRIRRKQQLKRLVSAGILS
jgi:glycosyltransferase involved in cell wall biosynthesis